MPKINTKQEVFKVSTEPTQEYFLQAMRNLGFTEDQIEANRKHNGGRYFLTPAVVFGMIRGFEVGTKVRIKTGELIVSDGRRSSLRDGPTRTRRDGPDRADLQIG
jgi:hypothetical protein